jgi:hypothetical protein
MTPSSSRTRSQPPPPHSPASSVIEYPASSKLIPTQMMAMTSKHSNPHHHPQHALTSILRPGCAWYRSAASGSTSSSSRLVEREHFAADQVSYLTPSSPTSSTATAAAIGMARATAPLSPPTTTTTGDASSLSRTAEKRTGSDDDESDRPPQKHRRFQRRNSQTASMLQAAISNFCSTALNNNNKESYKMGHHDHNRHHDHSYEQGTTRSKEAHQYEWLPVPHENHSRPVEPPLAEKAPTSVVDDSKVMDASSAAATAANFVEKAEELVRQIQILSRQRRKQR